MCAYTYTCSKNVFIYVYICIYVYVCAGYLRTHLLSSLSTCEGKVNEFFRLKSFNSTLPLSARYVHADNVYVWHMSMRVCVCVFVCVGLVKGIGEKRFWNAHRCACIRDHNFHVFKHRDVYGRFPFAYKHYYNTKHNMVCTANEAQTHDKDIREMCIDKPEIRLPRLRLSLPFDMQRFHL